ncbi:MAG: UDP-2,4-diacetamido-2,4,6-trideoxy-beta-L-altropyranose hydrolase, partial [Anaerolineae bacterium]|nr:UDP-2,4-diacetamido-2,4,6-trideoxy-beta-L-altropyranose hydrolase [Anaerolineae bacterium]
MKIAVRTDASHQIGTGHVMRCLALAEALRDRHAEVYFVCRELKGHLIETIRHQGYFVQVLPASTQADTVDRDIPYAHWLETTVTIDAQQTLATLHERGADALVVDHYALEVKWESVQRAAAKRILVLDDLANRRH